MALSFMFLPFVAVAAICLAAIFDSRSALRTSRGRLLGGNKYLLRDFRGAWQILGRPMGDHHAWPASPFQSHELRSGINLVSTHAALQRR
jgi:hypothetical protein